jgi:hypothetical protein
VDTHCKGLESGKALPFAVSAAILSAGTLISGEPCVYDTRQSAAEYLIAQFLSTSVRHKKKRFINNDLMRCGANVDIGNHNPNQKAAPVKKRYYSGGTRKHEGPQ